MNSFPNKILLPTDGSEDAALAARAAIDLSGETGAELHVVHTWQSVPSARFESFIRTQLKHEAEELLAEQEKRIEAGGGRIVGTHLRRGPAVDEILDLAGELEAGLIVMVAGGWGQLNASYWAASPRALSTTRAVPCFWCAVETRRGRRRE